MSDDGDPHAYLVATLGWLTCAVLEPARGEMLSATWMSMKIGLGCGDAGHERPQNQPAIKALLRELRSATNLTCLRHPVDRTRKARSSRQIVFLMLAAFACFNRS
jgi:hypothetical protein